MRKDMAELDLRELKTRLQAIIAKLQRALDAVEELSEDDISVVGALLGVASAKPVAKKPRKKPKGLGEYIRTGDHSRLMELTASIRHYERGHKKASPEEYEAWKREQDEIQQRLKKDSMERRKAAREARKRARRQRQIEKVR